MQQGTTARLPLLMLDGASQRHRKNCQCHSQQLCLVAGSAIMMVVHVLLRQIRSLQIPSGVCWPVSSALKHLHALRQLLLHAVQLAGVLTTCRRCAVPWLPAAAAAEHPSGAAPAGAGSGSTATPHTAAGSTAWVRSAGVLCIQMFDVLALLC